MALIEAPEFFRGRDTEGLRSVYDYLVRLSDQLNIALNSMSVTQFVPEEAAKLQLVTGTGETASQETLQQQIAQQAETLKAYIIKTASTVKYEMDEVFHKMVGTYDAESDEGTYSERWTAATTETALGSVMRFSDEVEETVEAGMASFHKYRSETQQVITLGLIDYDTGGVARYGLKIESIDGIASIEGDDPNTQIVTYNKGNTSMELTSDKLSFLVGGNEVAYMSSEKLFINKAEIVNQLSMGHLLATVNTTDGSVSIGYNSGWST